VPALSDGVRVAAWRTIGEFIGLGDGYRPATRSRMSFGLKIPEMISAQRGTTAQKPCTPEEFFRIFVKRQSGRQDDDGLISQRRRICA
jgi:hypothetical protein